MSIPNFYDPFNELYDELSMRAVDLVVPSWFDTYEPDNQDDYQCISVIVPNPERGANQWTINGQFITIGIYRDEGRDPVKSPIIDNVSWTRTGTKVTIVSPKKHYLKRNDLVSVYNVNVPSLKNVHVKDVIDEYRFSVMTYSKGAISGNTGGFQVETVIDFNQQYIVFRLLPSFKLVPISVIMNLFQTTQPSQTMSRRSFYNITTDNNVIVPRGNSKSVNFELPTKTSTPNNIKLARRFDQIYDEYAQPLKVKYFANGQAQSIYNVDSSYKNEQRFYLQPMKSNDTYNQSKNPRLYVYDFYGFDLNDNTRLPFLSDTNIIADPTGTTDIVQFKIKLNTQGDLIYNKKIHDEYGNLAIGVQANTNTLLVRKQILPLELDRFNKPIKKPRTV